ncbi:MAG: STAS domain-containing protein [Gemmatimonadetes bacterium]|nr:MAG: STAS domain-containing protein [Gemmatimonadota bacterium]
MVLKSSQLEVIEKLSTSGATITFNKVTDRDDVLVVTFEGKLDAIHSEGLFVEQRSKFKLWFEQNTTYKTVVFDLYPIEYINSLAIGHLCQFYLSLYKQKINVTVSTNPENPVHDVLDYCGFFELRGLKKQSQSLEEGIELPD